MSDKPSPKSMSWSFMSAALAVLVGSIALYMAIQVLKHIAVPLVILGCTVIAPLVFAAWRKRSGGHSDDW